VATEVAGAVIGINPFDQPDVEASKIKTRALTDGYEREGRLAGDEPLLEEGTLALFGDADLQGQDTARAAIRAHLARLQPGDYLAVLAYLERNAVHEEALSAMRDSIRDSKRVATVGGFGPRFLHSTGQAYKGGPNSGVFIQITADAQNDLEIPGRSLSFGVVEAAQAKGDLEVLAERGRRYLRVHIKGGDIDAGLQQIVELVEAAVA
jgi:transaldolase/glucose-6-phosphate isomerase